IWEEDLAETALARRRGVPTARTVLRRFVSRRKAVSAGFYPFADYSSPDAGRICGWFHPVIHCKWGTGGAAMSLVRKGRLFRWVSACAACVSAGNLPCFA